VPTVRREPVAVVAPQHGHDRPVVSEHDRDADGALGDVDTLKPRLTCFAPAKVQSDAAVSLNNWLSPGDYEEDILLTDCAPRGPMGCMPTMVEHGRSLV
jgi:hypothetical protein